MSRRRVIAPATYIRRHGPHRKVTSCAVGRHHLRMRERRYVTSSPVREDPRRPRLEGALTFFFDRFDIDFSDVVNRTPVLV